MVSFNHDDPSNFVVPTQFGRVHSTGSKAGLTQTRIKIRIAKSYRGEPVISRLTADHGLVVNITGATLGASSWGEGWFDLELRGTPQQIQNGLTYLQELDVDIWGKPNPDGDAW